MQHSIIGVAEVVVEPPMLPVACHPKRNARPGGLSRLKSENFKENLLSYPQKYGCISLYRASQRSQR